MTRPARRNRPRPSKSRRAPAAAANSSKPGLKIGDAARLVGVKPFVLRFWETQFPFLKSGHSRYKHRVYGPKDLENLKLVKRLLHEQRFTIEGAKRHLRELGQERARSEAASPDGSRRAAKTIQAALPAPPSTPLRQTLFEIRRELQGLQKLLKGD